MAVTADHPPTKVHTVLFVSSTVRFVRVANARAATRDKMRAPPALKRQTMVVLEKDSRHASADLK